MSTIGDRSFTSFQNVNLKGNDKTGSTDSGIVRIQAGGFATTVSLNTTYLDANRALTFPAKSGTMPISGTFSVDFPAIAATTFNFSTAVTVTGLRVEDAVTVTLNGAQASTARILVGAVPTADTLTLYFVNIGAAANGLYTVTGAYTAVR